MDFTREPIIETIITPKEGCKLVVRSSKSSGQEEYFVDALEIVSFGHALFYRSLERPKAFLAPVTDFEVLEVREARMVLKNVGFDRSIKIGGGRETAPKSSRESDKPELVPSEDEPETIKQQENQQNGKEVVEGSADVRLDKKRDRRRNYRKRRGREDKDENAAKEGTDLPHSSLEESSPGNELELEGDKAALEAIHLSPSVLSSLLQPPPKLISETINLYRQNDLFKSAFYLTEEEQYKPHAQVEDLLNEDEIIPLKGTDFESANEHLSTEFKEEFRTDEGLLSGTESEESSVDRPMQKSRDRQLEENESVVAKSREDFPFLFDESLMTSQDSLQIEHRQEGLHQLEQGAALPLFAEEEGGPDGEQIIAQSADYYSHFVEGQQHPIDSPEKKEEGHSDHS